MPLYKVAIEKGFALLGESHRWSNVYRVEAADVAEALDFGVTISNIEQGVHKDYVGFLYARARLDVPTTDDTGSRALTGNGSVTGDGALRLPNFNAVRCIFSDDVQRPDQKYLRLPLEEGDVVNGTLETTLSNLVSLDYVSEIVALGFIRSSDNTTYVSGSVVQRIQMRQENWHRRSRPGFHRAYVPD